MFRFVNGKMESINGEMFNSLPTSHLLITFVNSLDPDKAQIKLFDTLKVFLKKSKKLILKKSASHAELPPFSPKPCLFFPIKKSKKKKKKKNVFVVFFTLFFRDHFYL